MLVLLAPALAHSPHDVVPFVSVAPDGTVLAADTEVLAWTSDRTDWSFRYLDAGVPVCGEAESATRFTVLTEEAGAWTTTDGGATWTPTWGPTEGLACAQGVRAGADGLWVDGEQVGTTAVVDVARGSEVVALDIDGNVIVGPSWEVLPPSQPATAIAVDAGGRPVVATSTAGLARWDGAAWQEVPGSPLAAEVIHVSGDTWLAATATEGVWVSVDDGASWTYTDEGFEAVSDGPGSPPDGRHFLDFTVDDEGTWWSAQWEGLWWRRPEDSSWSQGALDIVPRTRGVQWLPDGRLLAAVYGGGVYRGTPGTGGWEMTSLDVRWPYPKQVVQVGDDLFLVSGSILYRSVDGGASWQDLSLGADDVGDHLSLAPDWPTDPRVVVGARKDGRGGAFVSVDRGETWTWSGVPGGCTEKPSATATDGSTTWLACGYRGELYRSSDFGLTWEGAATLDANVYAILAEEPPLLATERGLVRLEDPPLTVALEGLEVDALARGPDGVLWLSAPGSGVYRAEDEGHPTAVGWPLLDRVEDLEVHADGALAVGTRTGVWYSRDAGASWTRANPVDWLDDAIQFWSWEGEWETVEVARASARFAHDGGVGSRARLEAWGEQIRIEGGSDNAGTFQVWVDGEPAGQVDVAADTAPGLLWGVDLPAGPHRIELEVVRGRVYFDTAQVWRTDAPALPEAETPADPEGCGGCGGKGGVAALLLLPFAVPWARRRPRGGRRPGPG